MSTFYDNIKIEVEELGFSIIQEDFNRPWGGFFQIDQRQSQKFVHTLISKEINVNHLKISPKIFIFEGKTYLLPLMECMNVRSLIALTIELE